MLEPLIPYLIMLGFATMGGGVGYWLGRRKAWPIVIGLAAVLLGMSIYQWVQAQSAPSGWDGIAIALLVMLFLAPGLLGLLIGAGGAYVRQRRR